MQHCLVNLISEQNAPNALIMLDLAFQHINRYFLVNTEWIEENAIFDFLFEINIVLCFTLV